MKYHKNPVELNWKANTDPDMHHYGWWVRLVGGDTDDWTLVSSMVRNPSFAWTAPEVWRNKPIEFSITAVDTVGNVSERSTVSEPMIIDTLAPAIPAAPQIPGGIVVEIKVAVGGSGE